MNEEGLKQELEGLKCQICGQSHCKFKDHSLRRADVFAKLEKTIAKINGHKHKLFSKWEIISLFLDSEERKKA